MNPSRMVGIAGVLYAALFLHTPMQAQENIHYLRFDAAKMQCMDYAATDNFPRVPHWDYVLKVDENKRLLFRVTKLDLYSDTLASFDNKAELTADKTGFFTPEVIEAVNSSSKYLYIVEAQPNGTTIVRKADKIVQWVETPTSIQYIDRFQDFEYQYDKIYTVEEKNLSLRKGKGAKVYYQSREKRECTHIRTFRSFSEHAEDPYEDLKFLEGVGLFSIKTMNGELKLKSINGMTVEAYVANYCAVLAGKDAQALKGAENPYNGTSTNPKQTNPQQTNPQNGKTDNKDLYGGTSTNPQGGIYSGTGGTDPSQISNKEFVIGDENDPCKGVSPLDVNNPCNQMTVTAKQKTAVEPPPADGYYTAQQGDNLYKIANKFGLTTKALMCLNNKKDYSVGILEKFLVVDSDGRCTQSPNPLTRVDNEKRTLTKVHVVEQGENLGKIALKYNMTVDNLCRLNGLDDVTKDKIQIDQEIIISIENF